VLVLWLCSLLGSHTRSYLHIRMQTLSEYVDDTEDFINIELDSHRNQVCFDLCSPAHRSHPSSPLLTPPHPSSPLLTPPHLPHRLTRPPVLAHLLADSVGHRPHDLYHKHGLNHCGDGTVCDERQAGTGRGRQSTVQLVRHHHLLFGSGCSGTIYIGAGVLQVAQIANVLEHHGLVHGETGDVVERHCNAICDKFGVSTVV